MLSKIKELLRWIIFIPAPFIAGPVISSLLFIFILLSCDPLVTEFSNDETPKKYTSKTLTTTPNKDTLTVASWNIRFGIGRAKWFGDSCGDIAVSYTHLTLPTKRIV